LKPEKHIINEEESSENYTQNKLMNFIDKIMMRQFKPYGRDSLLNIILGKQKIFSTKWLKQKWFKLLLKNASNKGMFTLIHDKNLWNEQESVSGPGSSTSATKNIRDALPELFQKFQIKSVLDIPCGDFNWMQHVDLSGIHYIGADIVDELIYKNNQAFAGSNINFQVLDLINDPLPKSDLVLCRDGLVHLPYKEIFKTIRNIKNSGSKYFLTTSFTEKEFNMDIGSRYWRPVNFQIKPFNLVEPLMTIRENETDIEFRDKSLCLWKVEDLQL
jgi:SAM-dependent methyltransferase